MFRVAICDDNVPFLNYEKDLIDGYLNSHSIHHICDAFTSGSSLIQNIKNYDLIILDYQMEGLTGFETADLLHNTCPNSAIAFATNFYDFTREGYKYRAVRYLVKQEESFEIDLYECLQYVLLRDSGNKQIVIHLYDSVISVDINDIVYIMSDDHYIKYYIKNRDTEVDHLIKRGSLDKICIELPEQFIRIHQRYVVNVMNAMRIYKGKMEVSL